MAPAPVKKYQLVGSKWSSQHLELQHDGITFLWINARSFRHNPYITIHEQTQNGPILAAAKMGVTGWHKSFRIFVGNPDCTDLNVWEQVTCIGRWAREYRFCIDGQQFAWKRTRDKQLGSLGKGHQDFKLVNLGSVEAYAIEQLSLVGDDIKQVVRLEVDDEKQAVDLEEQRDAAIDHPVIDRLSPDRVLAIYVHNPAWIHSQRTAQITFFENLPKTTELWVLAAVLGLQEKISKNKDSFALASLSYGGILRPLGAYM